MENPVSPSMLANTRDTRGRGHCLRAENMIRQSAGKSYAFARIDEQVRIDIVQPSHRQLQALPAP